VIRIDQHREGRGLYLTVAGRLTHPWTEELERCWRACTREGAEAVHIELTT